MGKLILVLAILTALNLSGAKQVNAKKIKEPPAPKAIFEQGIYPAKLIELNESSSTLPPTPLRIYTPNITSTYPVLLFLHAPCFQTSFYSFLLEFIATHGYIVVAPQLFTCDNLFKGPVSGIEEVEVAVKAANWLYKGLDSVIPTNVKADLSQITIGGHGRGGKTAFAIALGRSPTQLKVKFAALIGLDPVAGSGKNNEEDPKILTYVPDSFKLSIPVTVIGTEYGNQTNWCFLCPVCAPDGVNHAEFYKESKAPASHIVLKSYGHVDFLNDNLEDTAGWVAGVKCKNGDGPKDKLRRTIGGFIVSFLTANFGGFDLDYMIILTRPNVTPVEIFTPEFKSEEISYAQF